MQDTLTWIKGNHSMRSGVAISRNRKDQNGRGNYFGSVDFNTGGNPNSTSNAVADMLLGNFRTYDEASADPVGFFRFTTYQGFVSDTWRVRNNLSLELGLRYEYTDPTYTQRNNLVNFDPSRYDPSQAVTVLHQRPARARQSATDSTAWSSPATASPRTSRAASTSSTGGDYDRIPFGAPRGLYDAQHLFMPRFSFSYSLNPTTVIRGGVGLFYDKPEGNVIFSQLNLPPVLANVVVRELQPRQPDERRRRRGRRGRRRSTPSTRTCGCPTRPTTAWACSGSSGAATSSRRRTSATPAAT